MFITETTRRILLFFLFLIIACFGIWLSTSLRKRFTLEMTIGYSKTWTSSLEVLCRPPNSNSFRRDQLTELIVTNLENRSVYVNESDASKVIYISKNYTNLTEFIQNTYTAIMSRRLVPGSQSIPTIFHNPPFKDMIRPSCDGLWMEFGVFRGGSLTKTANWKKIFCGNTSQPVYGFDTFRGLPTNWRPGFGAGAFNIPDGTVLSVPSNVVLVKGLFIDTLPTRLRLIDREYRCNTPVSFVHIDCDIYDGARDVLFLLGSRLVQGSIIVFDELFNYPGYEKHEIKALFEFLAGSDLRLKPLGSSGNIDLNVTSDKPVHLQSFAFVVD